MNVVPGSCSGGCVTSSDGPHEVTSIKVELDTDVDIKVEEIPELLSFPAIKSEQVEVSYMSVCLEYMESLVCFSVLHVYVYLNSSRVVYGSYCLFLGYVNSCEGNVSVSKCRGENTCLYLTSRI